jgi:C1A family cysteine protease
MYPPRSFREGCRLPISIVSGHHSRRGKRVRPRSCIQVSAILAVFALTLVIFPAPAAAAPQAGRDRGMGMVPSKVDPSKKMDSRAYGLGGTKMSSSVDLSSKLPPIGDQGQYSSCVGWATGYYGKTWQEKTEHPSWNIAQDSYKFSPQFVYNKVNGGQDKGASIYDALELLQQTGCTDWAQFPYDGNYTRQPDSTDVQAAGQYRISSDWGYFFAGRSSWPGYQSGPDVTAEIKAWLNTGKPVVMGIPIYSDFPDYGSNQPRTYYDYNQSAAFEGGHAVFIAGYNDNVNPAGSDGNHRGGFLMINSWGAGWNNTGKVYLSYDFVQHWVAEAWYMNDLDSSPAISSISPANAGAGQVLTITGDNLGAYRRSADVTFMGGAKGQPVTWTNGQVKVRVPSGARNGMLYVHDWDYEQSNGKAFTAGEASYAGANWLLAEGATWPGFDEWVLLQNPGSQPSVVSVAFLTPSGPVEGPLVRVEPLSRATLHVNEYVPNQDVSTAITVTSGPDVCVERAMYFSGESGKQGSHDSIATQSVAETWYLAEGATWPGFDEWILVMNPYNKTVKADITFLTPQGSVAGPSLSLAPNSRQSVHVNKYVPDSDVSATVHCATPGYGIVAERSMYMNTPDGKVDCHNSVGASETGQAWGLAEGATWPGFEEWVLVMNPQSGYAEVELYFLTPAGVRPGA